MRKSVLFGLLITMLLVVGCGPGVVRTRAERVNAYRHSVDMDLRQLADDWDMFWLMDREYRLTRWQLR
jgi:hypothetical protein